jgi:hypothetical protein
MSDYNIEWEDVIDYLRVETINSSKVEEIYQILNYEPDWDEVKEYLRNESLTSHEQNEILSLINHDCGCNCDDEVDSDDERGLKVKTLQDQYKFDIIENLYNNCSLEQLQKIEKKIFKKNTKN